VRTSVEAGTILLVPTRDGPDLNRDKLGLADDADRQALRELRIAGPIALFIGVAAWIAGAGLFALVLALALIFPFVLGRANLLRRKARRDHERG
jgi:hypothetical protein